MAMTDFDMVRRLGLSLPGLVDGTAYGAPALKLDGKLVTCIPTNKSAQAESLAVKIDLEHRAELLRQQPDVYYITDHYAPHPIVLVRLAKISRTDLRELLRDACHFVKSAGAPGRRGGNGRGSAARNKDPGSRGKRSSSPRR